MDILDRNFLIYYFSIPSKMKRQYSSAEATIIIDFN